MAECKSCVHFNVCEAWDKAKSNIHKGWCGFYADRARFVELPCKVGDTVYWNILGKPVEDEITNITIYDNCTRVFLKKGISFDIEDIGRIIFLSREKALEE